MLRGSIPALITPFDAHEKIDVQAFEVLLDFHKKKPSPAWVLLGSTAEALCLQNSEREQILSIAKEHIDRDKVVVGISAATTQQVLKYAEQAYAHGYSYGLVATPHYLKPTQAELIQHYKTIAKESGLKIILYTVPSRTGVDFSDDTIVTLAQQKQIVALKDAGTEVDRVSRLKPYLPKDFTYLSGDDTSTLIRLFAGAEGVISVCANIIPDKMQMICDLAAQDDWVKAREEFVNIQGILNALSCGGNPVVIKYLVAKLLKIPYHMRKPLIALDREQRAQIDRKLENIIL